MKNRKRETMPRTIGSKIAARLGKVVKKNTINDNGELARTVTKYNTTDIIPSVGNSTGDLAWSNSTNRLYIWSGNGWRSVAVGSILGD